MKYLLLILLLTGCGKLTPEFKAQESCGYVQNQYGERISWKGRYPVVLTIHESFPSYFYSALYNAISTWEAAAGKPLFIVSPYIDYGPLDPRVEGKNTIYILDNWEKDSNFEAVTLFHFWGDSLTETDLVLNGKTYSFFLDKPTSLNSVHMESLLLHELGHMLGLKHSDNVKNVMYPYLSLGQIRTKLIDENITSIQCEY